MDLRSAVRPQENQCSFFLVVREPEFPSYALSVVAADNVLDEQVKTSIISQIVSTPDSLSSGLVSTFSKS